VLEPSPLLRFLDACQQQANSLGGSSSAQVSRCRTKEPRYARLREPAQSRILSLASITLPSWSTLSLSLSLSLPSRRAWIFCHVLSRVCACRNDFAISDAKTVVNIINTRHCHRCSMLEFHLRNDRGMPASVSRRSQVSCGKGNNKCIRQPTRVNLRACIYIYIYICILVYVYIYIYMSYLAEMNIKIAREADSSGSIAPPLLIFSLLDRG